METITDSNQSSKLKIQDSQTENEILAENGFYWREKDGVKVLVCRPLEEKGFISIGCEPCTRKVDPEMQEREARWFGLNKVECGLHTDLINK